MKKVRVTVSEGGRVIAVRERDVDVASADEAVEAQPLTGSAKIIYDLLTHNDRPMDASGVDRTRRIGRYVDHIRQLPALYRSSAMEITAHNPDRGFKQLYDMMDDDKKREFDAESDAKELKKPMMVLYTLVSATEREEPICELTQATTRHMHFLKEDIVLNGINLRTCDYCVAKEGPDGKRLLRCGHCRRVCYCGPVCQRMAWPSHQSTCRPIHV